MKRFVFILVFLLASPGWGANPDTGIDLSLHLGGMFGTLSEQDPVSQNTTNFGYGGIPMGIGWTRDFFRWFSVQVAAHFVLDLVNAQITRTGLDVGFAFHLLGGARRTFTTYGDSELMVRDPYNVSLVLRTGFHSYNATAQVGDASVTGSIFDNAIGVQYRFDTSPDNAFAVEAFVPIYNLPAGSERITSFIVTVLGSWRFFL